MTNIITKTRNLILDNLDSSLFDSFTYYSDNIFRLSESSISESTIAVYVNGVLKGDSNYSFDSDTNELTYTGSLTSGDSVKITYSAYTKYSDNEIKAYIKGALAYLATERYKTFKVSTSDLIFPTPTESEEYLIALIAGIIINGDIKGYRTPDLTISFKGDKSKEDKIARLIQQFDKSYGYIDYIDLTEKIYVDIEED